MKYMKSGRVESLDAFRGVASFLIMVTHFLLMVPQVCQPENLGYIYGGLSWKLPYFFILSGFVLTLSYERSRVKLNHPFRSFIVSRLLRIYPLFFITTVVMYLLKVIFGAGEDIDTASIFFNISWRLAPSLPTLLHSLTLIGLENTWLYNGPAWTLVFEMRYALLFPLFFGLLRRRWLFITLFIAAAFLTGNIASQLERVDMFYSVDYQTSNMCSMFGFLIFYAGGILLALYRDMLSNIYNSLNRWGRAAGLVAVVALVLNPLWIRDILPSSLVSIVGDCLMLLGVALWVLILINNRSISSIFSNKMLVALGCSSFSIYMWHTPVITALYMLLGASVNVWYIVLLSVIVTIIIAQLSFRYIERPVIALSQHLRR